jgi:hypothetical protein
MSGVFTQSTSKRRLGKRRNDASQGDHTHNGANSKKLDSKTAFSNEARFAGSFNTDANGDVTIAHGLGAVPVGSVHNYQGTGLRGYTTQNNGSTDATNLVIRCFDASNSARVSQSVTLSVIVWV